MGTTYAPHESAGCDQTLLRIPVFQISEVGGTTTCAMTVFRRKAHHPGDAAGFEYGERGGVDTGHRDFDGRGRRTALLAVSHSDAPRVNGQLELALVRADGAVLRTATRATRIVAFRRGSFFYFIFFFFFFRFFFSCFFFTAWARERGEDRGGRLPPMTVSIRVPFSPRISVSLSSRWSSSGTVSTTLKLQRKYFNRYCHWTLAVAAASASTATSRARSSVESAARSVALTCAAAAPAASLPCAQNRSSSTSSRRLSASSR